MKQEDIFVLITWQEDLPDGTWKHDKVECDLVFHNISYCREEPDTGYENPAYRADGDEKLTEL